MLIALLGAIFLMPTGGTAVRQDIDAGHVKAQPSLKIVRAEYGAPGPTADITDRIAPMVQGDTLWMRVGAAETGPDPAPNVFKTLKVTYSYKGKTDFAFAQDTQSLAIGNLPGPAGQSGALHIIRAEYGPLDSPNAISDVSANVAANVKGNSLKLIVDDKSLGRSSGATTLKWIRVLYTFRGLVKTTTVPEGWILAIGDVPPSRSADSILRVEKAEYGLESSAGTRKDVTDLVSLAAAGGSLRMVVRPDVLGDESLPNGPKELTVSFVYQGQPGTVTVKDNDVMAIGPMPSGSPRSISSETSDSNSAKVKVLCAELCSLGNKLKPIDVTEKLGTMVTDEGLQVRAGASELGANSTSTKHKFLRVTYVSNGRVETVTTPINKDLAIGNMPIPKAQQSDMLRGLTPGPLHIMSVEYGILDQSACVEMTDLVSRLASSGTLSMGLEELNMETAPGVLKNIRILYVLNGRVGITIKNDRERVEIGGGAVP